MPAIDLIRESFGGQLIYYFSGRKYLSYAEDHSNFVLPDHYAKLVGLNGNAVAPSASIPHSETGTLVGRPDTPPRSSSRAALEDGKPGQAAEVSEKQGSGSATASEAHAEVAVPTDVEKQNLAQLQHERLEEELRNPYIVDWYSPTDLENPQNV